MIYAITSGIKMCCNSLRAIKIINNPRIVTKNLIVGSLKGFFISKMLLFTKIKIPKNEFI
jgi:hypothetical protein